MKKPLFRKRPLKLPFFHPVNLTVSWFGSGFSPIISGTAGSLATLPFAWVIHSLFGGFGLAIAALIIFLIGWHASDRYLALTGGGEDPGEIVIDETAGQMLLLAFLPLSLKAYAVGFVLFRLFDIVKPWPVSWADNKVGGGLGIMLDDILAALYPPLLLGIGLTLVYGSDALSQFDTLYSWLGASCSTKPY